MNEGRRNIWRIPTTERLRLIVLYTSNGIIASKGFIASRAFLGRSSSRSTRAQGPLPLIRRLRCMQAYCGCCACSLSFARIGIIVPSYMINLITFFKYLPRPAKSHVLGWRHMHLLLFSSSHAHLLKSPAFLFFTHAHKCGHEVITY